MGKVVVGCRNLVEVVGDLGDFVGMWGCNCCR